MPLAMMTRRQFALALGCMYRIQAQDSPQGGRDIAVDVAVTRKERTVVGLLAGDFRLVEDRRPAQVLNVEYQTGPLDMVLLLHPIAASTSANARTRRTVDTLRTRFLNGVTGVLRHTAPEDRVAMLTHTEPPQVLLPFTNDREAMSSALRRASDIRDGAGLSELVTFEYAVRMLGDLGESAGRRRIIVRLGTLLSGLQYGIDPVIQRLWSQDITCSAAEVLPRSTPTYSVLLGATAGLASSPRIAKATGGESVTLLDSDNPRDLITPLRQRYVLWFRQPDGLAPGQARSISVELSPQARERYPDAVVQARTGYITR